MARKKRHHKRRRSGFGFDPGHPGKGSHIPGFVTELIARFQATWRQWIPVPSRRQVRRVRSLRVDELTLSCLCDDLPLTGTPIPSRLVIGETRWEEIESRRKHKRRGRKAQSRLLIRVIIELFPVGTASLASASPCEERELALTYRVRHRGRPHTDLSCAVSGSCRCMIARLNPYDGAQIECDLQLDVAVESLSTPPTGRMG